MTVLQHWTIRRITGGSGTISHPWWTTAPGCPTVRALHALETSEQE